MAVNVADITSANVFDYQTEVIVELHGQTDDGEFTVLSYFFEPHADDPTCVTPRERIDAEHQAAVEQALSEADFTLC